MGFEMLAYPDRFPVFHAALGQVIFLLNGVNPLAVFNPAADKLNAKVKNVELQLALFSLEYCLAMCLIHQFGVQPA